MDKSRAEINNFERLNGITARCEFACGKLEEDGVLHWASGEMSVNARGALPPRRVVAGGGETSLIW